MTEETDKTENKTNDVIVRKVKVVKSGAVEANYIDVDGNEIALKGANKCHKDLRLAMEALVPYFADLTEQREADAIDWTDLSPEKNENLFRKLKVTGVSIGGDLNNPFITLTGQRILMTSRILNLNSPGVEMESETFEWSHIDEFDIALQNLIYEVKEYILNRKYEVAQQEINFDADPDDPFAEATPTVDVDAVEKHTADVA